MILLKTYKISRMFWFSNLNKKYELFDKENKKVFRRFGKLIPKIIWMDEFVCWRIKAVSYKCNDKNTQQLKGISISQFKTFNVDEYFICLFGGEYPKTSDNNVIFSKNHEMYLQKLPEKYLSAFDEKWK